MLSHTSATQLAAPAIAGPLLPSSAKCPTIAEGAPVTQGAPSKDDFSRTYLFISNYLFAVSSGKYFPFRLPRRLTSTRCTGESSWEPQKTQAAGAMGSDPAF
ncbi:jg27321 [Pararge aegeria aegeria]|uniref:Jg27321 protein n=1 Tax=Pararge aegeria aegeria TaxID=348720 RepID=A0A8S4QX80_9NEOP|nr:jg27321 [Pararge aegeria aegeria]